MTHILNFFTLKHFSGLLSFINSPTMTGIRNGLVCTMPLVVAGSLALLVNNFPVQIYQDAMLALFGAAWKTFGGKIWAVTFGALSFSVSFSIANNLAEQYNIQHPAREVSPVVTGLISLSCLAVMIIAPSAVDDFPSLWTGVGGLFPAIVIAISATAIFLRFSSIDRLRLNIQAEGSDPTTSKVFETLIPALLTLGLFSVIALLFARGGGLHQLLYDSIRNAFSEPTNEFLSGCLYNLTIHLTWFFGIHGPNLLDPVTHAIYSTAADANAAALAAGEPLPHIITKVFFDSFVFLGGSGATLGLVIAILLRSVDRSSRRIAMLGLILTMFNINEMILFGLPIILNPVYFIPFIAAPMVLTLTSYLAIDWGLVAGTVNAVDWTTPIFISGYESASSLAPSLLQLFNLCVAVAIYAPFVTISDKIKAMRFKSSIAKLMEAAESNILGPHGLRVIYRTDEVGMLARSLVNDLNEALSKTDEIFLVYQPQVNTTKNRVIGVEALMRWNHPAYGLIPPPIVVAVAEDGDLIDRLGLRVLHNACAQQRQWLDMGIKDVVMSVNVSAIQLKDDRLPVSVAKILDRYKLPPECIELEVTESTALDQNSATNAVLGQIHATGVHLAIDDFGMGHGSLLYFKQFPVSTLKIDKVLSIDVLKSKTAEDIIINIMEFCRGRGVQVVVEFVDNPEQLAALRRLGCEIFQGYLFSPPKSPDDCLNYIRNYKPGAF